jgi:transcriptional antiterminator RfaH
MAYTDSQVWIAVYTRPRWEKTVAAQLQRHGIKTYVPVQRQVRQWSDRKKIVEIPLLPSYVLIQIAPNQYDQVYHAHGIIRVVMFRGRIALIHQSEIDLLQRLEHAPSQVSLTAVPFHSNQLVRITRGPFEGLQGRVLRSPDGCRVALEIEQLSCAFLVELPCSWVEPLRQVA